MRRGVPYQLVTALRTGAFVLVVSAALRDEYEEVLLRPRFRDKYGLTMEDVAAFLEFVATSAVEIAPRRRLPVRLRDQKDEHVLAAALGGKARYLVTGDDDLLSLRDEPCLGGLMIVTAREFLGHSAEKVSTRSDARV